MADSWTERLSDYLDGELSPGEGAAVAAHLAECAACRATLEDLRQVAAQAGRLGDQPPARDLWPAVRAEILAEREVSLPAVRQRLNVPTLLAAGVALAVIVGSLARLLQLSSQVQPAPVAYVTPQAPPLVPAPVGMAKAQADYDAAVADLEQVLREGRHRLKPATVRVLEEKLALIDKAIKDARVALAQDSASAYLNNHLMETQLRKLELLRRAASLASTAS
jgi:anti-sigma factor ChrR (cupin superfamily)